MKGMGIGLALALAAGGCAGNPPPNAGTSNPLPVNYRDLIVLKAKETFFDPYSIRDAAISQPITGTSMMGGVATVCVRANAKNRMGGYTGLRATAFTFREGALTVVDTSTADISCASAVYGPFPELAGDEPAAQSPPKRRS